MTIVGRNEQALTVPELRSPVESFFVSRVALKYELACAATAWFCDLGPAYDSFKRLGKSRLTM